MLVGHCASITKKIRLGTAVVVLPLYNPARLAAEIATADALSNGRLMLGVGAGYQPYEFERFGVDIKANLEMTEEFCDILDRAFSQDFFSYNGKHYQIPAIVFGIGCGWNAEEMEDHGTVYETRTLKMREQIEAMKEIWTKDKPEYHGEIVDFPPMMTWPKPVQTPHPPIIVGGAFRLAARRAIRYGNGLLPAAPSAGSGSPEEFMPLLRQMAEKADRDPQSLSVTLGGAPEDIDILKRNRDLGVTRMTVRLPPAKEGEILPILDRWAKLIPLVRN
jgi:alkanesulfonate monooxygenase SsuD/methylene tetrahydromethanopterin reductase-like flavin-dependent oxidoreductase (luciferase family)